MEKDEYFKLWEGNPSDFVGQYFGPGLVCEGRIRDGILREGSMTFTQTNETFEGRFDLLLGNKSHENGVKKFGGVKINSNGEKKGGVWLYKWSEDGRTFEMLEKVCNLPEWEMFAQTMDIKLENEIKKLRSITRKLQNVVVQVNEKMAREREHPKNGESCEAKCENPKECSVHEDIEDEQSETSREISE